MSVAEALYPVRKYLVQAAEDTMKKAFPGNEPPRLEKSQLNHLIAVCNEAACSKEIELYLRYQASRESRPWPEALVGAVIEEMQKIVREKLPRDGDVDVLETGAWSLYAVYLARTFTYRKAAAKASVEQSMNHRGRGGKP